MAERKEGRLARWSRLKAKGGASEAESTQALQVDELPSEDVPKRDLPPGFEDLPDPADLPGGIQKRDFVPPMVPLAGVDEDAEAPAYEAPPPEAQAMLNGELTPPPSGAVPVDALSEDLPERELTEEEAEAVAALPPLESLDKNSDFTPYLADNIPEFIRNRALKILWRSDPLFGFQDGLDDYAENFRVIDRLIDAATDSSYRPGQGYDLPEDEEETVEGVEEVEAAENAENPEGGAVETASAETASSDGASGEADDGGSDRVPDESDPRSHAEPDPKPD